MGRDGYVECYPGEGMGLRSREGGNIRGVDVK